MTEQEKIAEHTIICYSWFLLAPTRLHAKTIPGCLHELAETKRRLCQLEATVMVRSFPESSIGQCQIVRELRNIASIAWMECN